MKSKRQFYQVRQLQTQSSVEMEMACLLKMQHKNVISLREIIDDPSSEKVYLVMDFCEGGTLH